MGFKPQQRPSGTREWSTHSANILKGCKHDCRYCYAKHREVHRLGTMTKDQWVHPKLNVGAFNKRWRKVEGTIMFPTSHDITPEFIDQCSDYLVRMLTPGNKVLIVSKPHLSCIDRLTTDLEPFKANVLFRFTICADDDAVLKYWEPEAPGFEERLNSLAVAKSRGFETSVSCEPMLDAPNIVRLVEKLRPHVTDSIWIGKMNDISNRVKVATAADVAEVERIRRGQTNTRILEIYAQLKDDPLIKWKESIKEVVGIATPDKIGMDI